MAPKALKKNCQTITLTFTLPKKEILLINTSVFINNHSISDMKVCAISPISVSNDSHKT